VAIPSSYFPFFFSFVNDGAFQASKWRQKEVGEGSTASYLTLHTKPCPKCHTPIAVHVCDAKCSNACQQKNRPVKDETRKEIKRVWFDNSALIEWRKHEVLKKFRSFLTNV